MTIEQFTQEQYCCDAFREQYEKGAIESMLNLWTNGSGLCIHGNPDFADYGDDGIVDETNHIEIKFCPFCGAQLKNVY